MKHLTFLYILLTVLLAQGCFAQYTPPRVEVSGEKVTLDGQLYYLHKVQKRETLYSIAKAYETDIESLREDNPSLESGLKEGSLLYIRIPEKQREERPETPETEKKKDETKKRDTLNIRYQAEHTVKWFESLSAIAKKYGVTEEEIIIANSIKNRTIETRQILKIPYPGEIASSKRADDSSQDQEKKKDSEEKTEIADLFRKGFDKIDAVLLLPMGGDPDSLFYNESSKGERHNFLDFCQGFLLALEDLKSKNSDLEINLRIIDTEDHNSTQEIISEGLLRDIDIVVGPVYEEELQPVLEYCHKQKTYVISPMDSRSEHYAGEYDNFFQVSTPAIHQQKGMLSTLNMFSKVTVIFEKNGNITHPVVERTTQLLSSEGVRYNILSYGILDGRSILPSIQEQLDPTALNHIIVASESEAFVSDVLRNLNLIKTTENYEIVIHGTPAWRNFNTIDISYYHDMNLNIPMQYHIDYSRKNTIEFVGKYRALYNSEPSPYSFQAYDIALYFFGNMHKYGNHFLENASGYKMEMLQSDYNFIRNNPDEGYINTATRRVIFKPDYSITDIRGFFR
jgi:LysM repeat protein